MTEIKIISYGATLEDCRDDAMSRLEAFLGPLVGKTTRTSESASPEWLADGGKVMVWRYVSHWTFEQRSVP